MSLILIIEDSRLMAEAVRAVLTVAGHEAVCCLTVAEGLSICQERQPDLVVTEFYLQEGTGLDFLEKVAKLDPSPLTVMATGCGREEVAATALSQGAGIYHIKSEGYLKDLPELVRLWLAEKEGRRASEEKANTRRRMEAQNELAGWLAHNFKNILAASIGYLNLINFKNPDQDKALQGEYIHESLQNQETALNLLEQLIRLTEAEGGESERIVLAEVVDEAWAAVKKKVLKSVGAQYPERLEAVHLKMEQVIFFNSARRLEPVQVVRSDVYSILEALLQNALEAVLSSDDARILVSGEKMDKCLEMTIRDNGRGMSETVLKHILEPFFSTKGEVGVGLSLSLANSLVLRHGGEWHFKSTPGAGTTVKVVLPL